jgi:hypothetical protein
MAQAQTLTNRQVIAGFRVSDITIFNWRKGTATKDPLPSSNEDGTRVLYKPTEVKRWAKAHGLAFDLEAALQVKAGVPGPKAKVAAKVPPRKASKA